MTKNNPDILCPSCRKFDDQFSNEAVSLDVWTACNCDYEYPPCDKCGGELMLCPEDWPWNPDFWICPNCDSTYTKEE
jgi:hypothetical protein